MSEFVREYLSRRDGNKTPAESWKEKHEAGKPPTFELSFRLPFEKVPSESFQEVLLLAASSGSVYAHLHFRFESSAQVFYVCDRALDFCILLRKMDLIGHAVPLYTEDPKSGFWAVELYPIEAVPESQRGILKPGEILHLLLGQSLRPESSLNS